MLHRNMPLGDVHIIHNWEAANAAALAAIVPLVSDKGKLAWQLDTNEFFFLANNVGPVWLPAIGIKGDIGPSGAIGPPGTDGLNGLNGVDGAPGEAGIPYKWVYANAAARLAEAAVVAGDIGKIALQQDNNSYWVLTSIIPTWISLSGAQVISSNAAAIGALTLDCRLADVFELTLTGNITLNMSNGLDGQIVVIRCLQDATGSRILTIGADLRTGSDIPLVTLTTIAGKTDYIGVRYNASANKYDVVGFIKGY